ASSYSLSLSLPRGTGPPWWRPHWYPSAVAPAQNGAAALVPLASRYSRWSTFHHGISRLVKALAGPATSGTSRLVPGSLTTEFNCHGGRAMTVLTPPPAPVTLALSCHASC